MEEQYKNFFEEMKSFKEKQNKQKQRGLNDYNLLTTVLSADDEVRLHSRMLHSLLAPDGLHYQGSLFLELFLDVIDFRDKSFEIEKARVGLEYKHIDLHITDGEKHVIIENKIYAGDQESQIKRYIESLIEEDKVLSENITVIYLSIDRKKPSDYSLGKIDENSKEYFTLSEDKKKLYYKGCQENLKECIIDFKSIHYKTDIIKWLKECEYEVQNITNLSEAIRQYKDVVKIIIDEYRSKSMQLKDFLGKDNSDNLKIAYEIYKLLNEGNIKTINEDNRELAQDVHNNFLKTIDEKYKYVGMKIGQVFLGIENDAFRKIKKINPFILSSENKMYTSTHYLNLILENEIIIQLEYRNYFKLSSINVQYHNYNNEIKSSRRSLNINFGAGAEEDDFYNLLTNEKWIGEICNKHSENNKLITILEEEIKNIER